MRNPKNIYNYIKTFNKKNKAKFNKSIFSFNYQRGISLIALVVTIAILMILAGITINVAFGENGILKSAEEFSNKVQNAQEQKNQERSNLLEELEETMTGGVEGLISPKITWSNEKATLTLNLTDQTYTVYYKQTDGEYTQYIEPIINLNHGDKIDVRLSKENKPDKTVTINIIDIQTPSATINLSTNSTNAGETITATVTQTDKESGVNIAGCKYIYNQVNTEIGTTSSAWNDATVFSNKTQTIELTANEKGSYYLHVLTIDKAGNKKETVSEEVIVEEVPGIGAEVIATADDKNAYYGKTVTNYTCENSAGVSAWKIFYADSSNIYIIAGTPIHYRYIPFSVTNTGTTTTRKPEMRIYRICCWI